MRERLVFLTLIALHLGVRFVIWLRPVGQLDDLVLLDDSYLSLHLARSIGQGLGPLYGLAPTNGFQPLYVFLMSPVFSLAGGDPTTPVRVALLLLMLADALAMLLTLQLARRLGCSIAACALGGLVWALAAYSMRTSLNGLETSLATAALAATLLAWERVRAQPARASRWALLGALVGLAYLARIDTLLLLPVMGIWGLVRFVQAGDGRAAWLQGGVFASAAALAVALPWLAYSWHWTHDLFPVSGRAVRYINLSNVHHAPDWATTYAPMLKRAALSLARNLGPAWAVVLALALAATARGASRERGTARLRALLPGAAFGALLVGSYAFVVFGPWYFQRYFYPLIVPTALAVGMAADGLLRTFGAARRAAVAAIALVVIAGSVADPRFRALLTPGAPPQRGYMRIGLWARDHFPPGTIIGGAQSGALGYFAPRLTVVNLDGVVNRDAYHAMRDQRLMEYVRGTGIRYLVWQDDIEFLARESRGYDARSLTHLGRIERIETEGWPWQLYRVEDPASEAIPR